MGRRGAALRGSVFYSRALGSARDLQGRGNAAKWVSVVQASARLREWCRQAQAEVVSNSRNKIHATWGPLFSPVLYAEEKHRDLICRFRVRGIEMPSTALLTARRVLLLSRGEPVAPKYGRFSRISLNAAGEGVRSERCGKLALQGCNNDQRVCHLCSNYFMSFLMTHK